jgi:hypothetical protein
MSLADTLPASQGGTVDDTPEKSAADQDKYLVTQATHCFLSNPLGCVAYNAYGVLLLQLLQQHPQWVALHKFMVPVPEDLAAARPCLIMLDKVHQPLMDLNPLSIQGIRSMVDNLMDGLIHWTHNNGLAKILTGSIRVTYNSDNTASIEFILITKQTPAKG